MSENAKNGISRAAHNLNKRKGKTGRGIANLVQVPKAK